MAQLNIVIDVIKLCQDFSILAENNLFNIDSLCLREIWACTTRINILSLNTAG
jgi:hypothetical protein